MAFEVKYSRWQTGPHPTTRNKIQRNKLKLQQNYRDLKVHLFTVYSSYLCLFCIKISDGSIHQEPSYKRKGTWRRSQSDAFRTGGRRYQSPNTSILCKAMLSVLFECLCVCLLLYSLGIAYKSALCQGQVLICI